MTPDGRGKGSFIAGSGGWHPGAFQAPQGGLLNSPPEGRWWLPLTASSQKSSAGIGDSRVGDGWIKRQGELGAGPYVAIR